MACLVILDAKDFKILYQDFEVDTTDYPYVPGFLAFKEIPSLWILFDRLRATHPELEP